MTIEGRARPADGSQPFIPYQTVSDDYFRTMGIPLKQGRIFGPQDHETAPGAIVISETMAKKYWPKGDAIGAHIRLGPNFEAPWLTVVGIVGDVREDVTKAEAGSITYATVRQMPWYPAGLVVRTAGDPMASARTLEAAVRSVDRAIPIFGTQALDTVLEEGLSKRKLPAALMTAFGALALLLASVGVYAMFATMAASREREFGIRVALGSPPVRVAGLVLRQGALWMTIGLVGGAVGIVLVTRALGGMIYGVAPLDPLALGGAFVMLLVCAALALLGPLRRATRADPISVLR
jgi:putative ABC transport system permease protein